MHYVYIVECKDGSLYTGWTLNIEQRIEKHNQGKASKYTRGRCPVKLRHLETFATKKEALQREYFIKQLTREKKLALIYSAK